MLFVVPFDGSDLSKAALAKATLYAIALEETPGQIRKDLFPGSPPEIVAVSVIPEDEQYARRQDWIDHDEAFRPRVVAERLHRQVTDIAPSSNFQTVRVDKWAPKGSIASRIRKEAIDLGATDLFIGSENAGRLVTSISSIGERVSADRRFDVHIVRQRLPPDVQKRVRSNFYLPG